MKKIVVILAAILLSLLGLYLMAKHCCAPKVEDGIREDAQAVLASSEDYASYAVDVDGWNITVSGEEKDSITTSNLMLALGAIPVVKHVDSAFGIEPEVVADTEAAEEVEDSAETVESTETATVDATDVVDTTDVVENKLFMFNLNKNADGVTLSDIPEGFDTQADKLTAVASDFEKLDISIEGDKVKVVGDVTQGMTFDAVKQKILGLLPDYDVDFDLSQSGLDDLMRICQSELNQFLDTATIQFETNSDALSAASVEELSGIVPLLKQCATAKIEIEGHTDSTGSADWNQTLSQLRAESIKTYLVSQGIPAEQLMATGAGASKPIATNQTAEGRQLNRRIEMIVKAN